MALIEIDDLPFLKMGGFSMTRSTCHGLVGPPLIFCDFNGNVHVHQLKMLDFCYQVS